jgi:hypothetical protein
LHSNGQVMLECEMNIQATAQNLLVVDTPNWWLDQSAGIRRRLDNSTSEFGGLPSSSTVVVGVKDTVPSPQFWSRCAHCALEIRHSKLNAVLFDPRGALKQVFGGRGSDPLLSSTKWRGFFHEKPEHISGRYAPEGQTFVEAIQGQTPSELTRGELKKCMRVITRPIFVFSILTWQIGHLLIDVLEPLFHTMVSQYGQVPLDLKPVLILEVAGQPESEVLLEKITADVWEGDTPFSLLKLFTNERAIFTTNSLRALVAQDSMNGGQTCFTDLHLGLDVSDSYYARGFDRHPFFLDPAVEGDAEARELGQKYETFRTWLWGRLGLGPPTKSQDASQVVTVVRRESSRSLRNADAFFSMVSQQFRSSSSQAAVVNEVSLESLGFSDQLALFQKTTVFIAQYGTAVHNCLFLRPKAVLALFMQPYWCDWAWAFASQAALLRIDVHVVCDEPAVLPPFSRMRWHEMGSAQGPWWSKDSNYSVDIELAAGVIRQISNHPLSAPIERGAFVRSVTRASSRACRQCNQAFHAMFAADHLDTPVSQVGWDAFKEHAPTYNAVENESTSSVRTHIGGITVNRVDLNEEVPVLRVKMVPEVIFEKAGSRDKSLHDFLRNHPSLQFCSEVFDPFDGTPHDEKSSGPGSCQPSTAFNEFSTLDLQLQGHARLIVHAWLREDANNGSYVAGAEDKRDYSPDAAMTGFRRLPGSDTFFVVDTTNPRPLSSEEFPCGGPDLSLEIVIDGAARVFQARLWEPTELQRATAAFCARWGLADRSCAVLANAVAGRVQMQTSDFLNQMMRVVGSNGGRAGNTQAGGGSADLSDSAGGLPVNLPPPQATPTPGEPFVFLHHEKCAGTSLRRHIARSALKVGASYYVPCFDPENASGPLIHLPPFHANGGHPASCMSFDLAPVNETARQKLAVIAGHFQWGVWWEGVESPSKKIFTSSARVQEKSSAAVLPPKLKMAVTPRVFVMLREPVERTISLYYERLFPYTQVHFQDFPNFEP